MRVKCLLAGCMIGSSTTLLALLGSIYTFFCPALNMEMYNRVIFGDPEKDVNYSRGAVVSGCRAEDVEFSSSSSLKLRGRLYDKKDSDLIYLYSHGKGLNITWIDKKVDWLLNTGASVFTYDYRGFGESEGSPSISGVVDDARAAYDYIVDNTRFKPEQIILYGESLGSGISCALAEKVERAGLVLDSPYISLSEVGKDKYPFLQYYPSWTMPSPNLSCIEAVTSGKSPLLVITARGDRHIPSRHSQYLYEIARGPKSFLECKNCFHGNFQKDLRSYKKALTSFVSRCSEARVANKTLDKAPV